MINLTLKSYHVHKSIHGNSFRIVAAIYAITLFYTIVTFQRSKRLDQITSLGDVMNELRDVDRELAKIPSGSQFDGVYDPERFVVLDKKNLYRIANGTVMDVFTNPSDGDYHVHVLVDEQYRDYLKVDFVLFPYGELLRIMSFVIPFLVIVSYLIVSIIKPRYTVLGRYIFLSLRSNKSSK